MHWGFRLAWATLTFAGALVAVYNLYVWTHPVQHDLSDISTGLFGLMLGGFAGLMGASVVLIMTGRRRH